MIHHFKLIVPVAIVLFFGSLTCGPVRAESPQGNIQQGEKIFAERKCSACHMVHGKGGRVGPDLSEVAGRRDETWMKKFLVNPKSVFSKTIMPPFQGSSEELEALVAYLRSLK